MKMGTNSKSVYLVKELGTCPLKKDFFISKKEST